MSQEETTATPVEQVVKKDIIDKIKDKEVLDQQDLNELREIYVNYANNIKETISKNWFTSVTLSQKLKASQEDTDILLEQLMYFELCVCKKEKGFNYFKIDINKQDLIKILQDEKSKLTVQLQYIDKRLNKLTSTLSI